MARDKTVRIEKRPTESADNDYILVCNENDLPIAVKDGGIPAFKDEADAIIFAHRHGLSFLPADEGKENE